MKSSRTGYYSGTHYEIGLSIGKQMGKRLPGHTGRYLDAMDSNYGIDFGRLEKESMLWLDTLQDCYREEMEGIAFGAEYPIERLAQFSYCDRCVKGGCTSFIQVVNGNAWVGRNNDFVHMDSWGYVNILKALGKIPVMLFGMEGDTFSGTGYNKEKIWLHYNWLPIWDIPSFEERQLSPFVFIRLALETCKSLEDVEYLLKNSIRDGGMNLFAVDGKSDEFLVCECGSRGYRKRQASGGLIAGANHYCQTEMPAGIAFDSSSSITRQSTVENLLSLRTIRTMPDDFINVLSDPMVEQNNGSSGTVYSNVCCPARDEIWYAWGALPAASRGRWEKVDWD